MTDAHGYPRPQLERWGWISLNGPWDFALDATSRWSVPNDVTWSDAINVPFSPETTASGIAETGFFERCWYKRQIELPTVAAGDHLILHFGAVDYEATVWANGQRVAHHEGGYTPFEADITRLAGRAPAVEIVVRADDDPHDLAKPRGKQDWQQDPHVIWYPRTSGIWQTVWLERVPATWIASLVWTPNFERWEIGLEARAEGAPCPDARLHVRLHVGDLVLADDVYSVNAREATRRIGLSDPGIDDFRNELLWSPASPTIIDAEISLLDGHGRIVDTVRSYTALRSIATQADHILLNGRPYGLRLALDQGYWPETGLTAPDDGALRRDVELAKRMGFNGVRKHQKIEDPRYLYWADHLGLLVWEEMPSAYRFTRTAIDRLTREWSAAMARDLNHPSIVAWVPFNESWGVPNLPEVPAQRHFVQALYHLTRTLDPTRPVIGNDGWESVATDIVGIHDYDEDLRRLARRYIADEVIPRLFRRERPGGRLLALDGHEHEGQPIMLTEFGGIVCAPRGVAAWGHARASDPSAFARQYEALLATIHRLRLFAGFCYTQFADTYQEANGLLTADRTPKFPLDRIRAATRGPRTARQEEAELERTERMEEFRRTYRVPVP